MKDVAVNLTDDEKRRRNLLALISEIAGAKSLEVASSNFDEYLNSLGAQLLAVKFCDSANNGEVYRPYFGYPEGVANVSAQLIKNGGCPFSKEASRRLDAFDSCTIDRSLYDTLLDRRFFQEIDKLEHKHIAVVPVIMGRAIALFNIGLGVKPFKGHMRGVITESTAHTVPAFIDRFPEIKTIFEQKHLSELEREVLTLFCDDLQLTEIVQNVGLSEFTIRHIVQNASEKLQVNNTKQLIYRAIALGEIPGPRAYSTSSS